MVFLKDNFLLCSTEEKELIQIWNHMKVSFWMNCPLSIALFTINIWNVYHVGGFSIHACI